MIAIVQRVIRATVEVRGSVIGEIGKGLAVLASVERGDTIGQMQWMAEKLATLRIFPNGEKEYDLDVSQIGGGMLLVSNFTVAAATRKGRRPSLDGAADPQAAGELFQQFVEAVKARNIPVATGEFRSYMTVTIVNDGPSTFIVRSDPPAA